MQIVQLVLFLLAWLRFFTKLFFYLYGVAGDMFTANSEEEVAKDKHRTAKDKETDFDRLWPASGKEKESINNAKAECVTVAAN